MKLLVAGASGFVGRRLCPALVDAGHDVRAMTRHPDTYAGAGTAVPATSTTRQSLRAALARVRGAYYLVHSLDDADFARPDDAAAARRSPTPPPRPACSRIVYLGGLGDDDDDLSAHLRSRREVEALLGAAGVPVTTLRAGIIVGHGGISWEMTRQLVEHLPAMITPALGRGPGPSRSPSPTSSATSVGVLEAPDAAGRAFEIGGPEVLALRRDDAAGRARSRAARCSSCRCRCSPRGCPRAGWRSSPTSTCRPAAR